MNRFSLHFTAFVGSASALALVLVAVISFACQSARVGQGGDKGREMWNSTASRPQDGLSQAVDTPRPTGGKPVDLRRATREVAAGSPDLEDCRTNALPVNRLGGATSRRVGHAPSRTDLCGSLQGDRFVRQARKRRDGHPEHAYSSSVTGREWTPSRGTLRSDWDREPRLSKHGVRRVPARDVVLEVTETGRGPFLQAFRGGAAWKDTQPSVETRGARSNPQVINPSLVVNGKYASWPSLASVRGHVGEPTRAQSTITGIKPGHHLKALATAAAHLCGVPVAIFHALIHRESSWRPWVVSSSGAVGLGQIKPSTLRDIDPRLNAWEPWDNLLGSACYLRQQFDRFGTWRKALHAYHGGPNRKATRQATHDYATDIIEASN